MNMEIQNIYDLFEPGDSTALVCIDEPEFQRIIIDQVRGLGYKIHTGLFSEDISLKLKTHIYDVVIIYENFNSAELEGNQVLLEAISVPASQRRLQFIVLVGPNMVTNDAMQAYLHSVDLVFGVADLQNLTPVLRRGAARHKEFYSVFNDCLKSVQAI
jgi:hypothetical protein